MKKFKKMIGLMAAKLFCLAIIATAFVACSSNKQPIQTYSGQIIGYVGCYDERDSVRTQDHMHMGMVVVTNTQDTFLTFSALSLNDSVRPYGLCGTYEIDPVTIPSPFGYSIIAPSDERYVKIAPMYEDTFHQGLPMSVYDMKQAFIIMMATL